jgi:hypothetical protein
MEHTSETLEHMVATCAHRLASPQWRLVHMELDVGAEHEVTHGR